MKISELVKITGVPKQTIHYYIQKGLLPRARKLGSNSAEYSQVHVERIRMIKDLQENYFLPLDVIRKILTKFRRQPDSLTQLKIKAEYFKPLDQLLSGSVRGEANFIKATGLQPERARQYEEWGLLTPVTENGRKVYSHEDCLIGKLIAQYRAIGMTRDRGFEPDILKELADTFRTVVRKSNEDFFNTARRNLTAEEIQEIVPLAAEITASFYYHLYHKLNREMNRKHMRFDDSGT